MISSGGNYINYSHIKLVIDLMTRTGKLLSFNRHGVSKLSSLMERVSFETSIPVISNSTFYGEKDDMQSPISNLITGQKLRCGTGLVDIIPIIDGINDTNDVEEEDAEEDEDWTYPN